MKLYYTKGTCSFGPHVALREVGASFDLVPVNLREKKLADDGDYRAVSPRGYVPYLETDEGMGLAECAVILQYIADKHPDAGLAPAPGSAERYKLQEWLSFIGGELHKGLPPLFLPNIPDDYRPVAKARLDVRMGFLDDALAGKDYLMGDEFSIADAYAVGILNWTIPAQYDLSDYPNVKAYYERLCARDSVKEAHAAES